MSFWQSITGAQIDGSDQNSFASNLAHLPNNTVATAMIKNFILNEYDNECSYQIIWELLDGEFKGCEVKQRITPFDPKDERAQRALNMLMRIYNLCEQKPSHENMPQNEDLEPMKGKICCIKIGNGIIEGQPRTWVREVHKSGTLFTETGHTSKENKRMPVETAMSRNPRVNNNFIDDDAIPF